MHENLAYGLAVRCNLTCGSRMTAEVEELSQFLIMICEHYRYPGHHCRFEPKQKGLILMAI
jgi:hypothetical protein